VTPPTRFLLALAFSLLSAGGLSAQTQASAATPDAKTSARVKSPTPHRVEPRETQTQAKSISKGGTDAGYLAHHGLPNPAARDSATGPGNYSAIHGIGPGAPYNGNATYGPDIQVHGQ
jgi:hypothetical protein